MYDPVTVLFYEVSRLVILAVGALLVLIYNALTIVTNSINKARIMLDGIIDQVEDLL